MKPYVIIVCLVMVVVVVVVVVVAVVVDSSCSNNDRLINQSMMPSFRLQMRVIHSAKTRFSHLRKYKFIFLKDSMLQDLVHAAGGEVRLVASSSRSRVNDVVWW